MTITATHKLVSESWMADVNAVETAIRRFRISDALSNDCQVMLFEMAATDIYMST